MTTNGPLEGHARIINGHLWREAIDAARAIRKLLAEKGEKNG